MTNKYWEKLTEHDAEIKTLSSISSLLAWDQQVNMPPSAGPGRGTASAMLSKLRHQAATKPERGEWLAALQQCGDLSPIQQRGVEVAVKDYEQSTKLPEALVVRDAKLATDGYEAWHRAREEKDFGVFAPVLEQIIATKKELAACLDPEKLPLDVSIDQLDPGETVADLTTLFAKLKERLVPLIGAIERSPKKVPALDGEFPRARQLALHKEVLAAMGYSFDSGRLDLSTHPFTIRMGDGDVRVTTRVDERDLLSGLGGTVHEGGHALYEQGIPKALSLNRAGRAASIGLHESQSRFWENMIGRSRPFFDWFEGPLRKHLPDAPKPAVLYEMANRVSPGFIRVDADEVTYNLHVIIRFELERALFAGELTVADLPAAWDDAYERDLGIRPDNVVAGVLQDIHWGTGGFGYFQSYTLGNLYAASLDAAMRVAIPNVDDEIRAGRFEPVLGWLRTNVHERAFLASAKEIVADAVGQRDHVDDFMDHLMRRHGAIYGL